MSDTIVIMIPIKQGSLLTGLDTPSQLVILWLISCRPQDSKTDQHQLINNRYFVSVAKRKRSRKSVTYGARFFVLLFLQERYFKNEKSLVFLTRFSTKILVIRLGNGGRLGGRAGRRILNGVKLWFPLNNLSLLWPIHTKLAV